MGGYGGYQVIAFTPHARGSTPHGDETSGGTTVYPACAGIDHLT